MCLPSAFAMRSDSHMTALHLIPRHVQVYLLANRDAMQCLAKFPIVYNVFLMLMHEYN